MECKGFPKISLAAARVNANLSQDEAAKKNRCFEIYSQELREWENRPSLGDCEKDRRGLSFPCRLYFFVRRFALSECRPWHVSAIA